jgi:hypothetical protein
MGTTNLDSLTLGGNLTVAGTEVITGGVQYAGAVTLGDASGDAITVTGTMSTTTPLTVTSANASALAVGRQGATSPALKVDASTSSSATGIGITAAASGAGVAVAALGGAAEALAIDAKGTGTITLAGTSTGNVIVPRAFVQGTDATDRVVVKGIYMNPAAVSVAVPTIANDAAENADSVDVDVSAAFSIQPAVGDAVIAIPTAALPTDCLLTGAYVSATDHIIVTFTSKEGGGGVTGASVNFNFLVIDLT